MQHGSGSIARRSNSKIPALIIGSGITALGTMRSLHRAGLPFYCVAPSSGMEAYSRYYRPLPVHYPELISVQQLSQFLSALPIEQAAVLACSDHLAQAVASLRGDLRERFPCSQSSLAVLQLFTDKGAFARALTENKIPSPNSILVTDESQIRDLARRGLGPYFFKPRDSQSFFQTYGVKAYQIHSLEEALLRYREIAATGFEVLLQEYIEGPPSAHYYVEGFIDQQGRNCATFARQRLRMYPARFGNSSITRSVDPREVASAAEHLQRLFKAVGYRGIYSAEFKRDPRDDVFKLLEVNSRPWWYIGFAEKCGINIAAMAYRDALNEPVEPQFDYQVGRELVYPYYDYYALQEDFPQSPVRRWSEIARWLGKDFAVFDRADPLPAWHELIKIAPRKRKPRSPSPAPL